MTDIPLPRRGAERESLVATTLTGKRHHRAVVDPPERRRGAGAGRSAAPQHREAASGSGAATAAAAAASSSSRQVLAEAEALLQAEGAPALVAKRGPVLRYRTDLDKAVIHFMFERLGQPCEEVVVPSAAAAAGDEDDGREYGNTAAGDWHLYWMSVGRVRHLFSTAELRLQDTQIINHFPNHYELTRKDLMYKNIKKYIKSFVGPAAQQALVQYTATDWPSAAALAGGGGGGLNGSLRYGTDRLRAYNFTEVVPITYNLPNDTSMFTEEFKRHPGATWIVKPTSRSQGKGIFLINRLSQLARWSRDKREVDATILQAALANPGGGAFTSGSSSSAVAAAGLGGGGGGGGGGAASAPVSAAIAAYATANSVSTREATAHYANLQGNFIVSKYIENPLLIGGKKFDMRLYVLVTSYKPLVAYLHEEGFARFCATKYKHSALGEDDLGSHLTNVALQKGVEEYNTVHGGKWSLQNLFLYVQARHGPYVAEGLMANIRFLIYHSLKAMEVIMFNDKHSYELYGYDILIDADVRPHLIEVNASPSLSTTTLSDRLIKEKVLADTLKIVLPPGFPGSVAAGAAGGGAGNNGNLSNTSGGKRGMPYWEYRTRTDLTTQLNTGFHLLQV